MLGSKLRAEECAYDLGNVNKQDTIRRKEMPKTHIDIEYPGARFPFVIKEWLLQNNASSSNAFVRCSQPRTVINTYKQYVSPLVDVIKF